MDGTGVTEPASGTGYARVSANGGSFAASNGAITNNSYLYFPEATGSWGTCTHYLIFDKDTGGNLLAYGALTDVINPVNGTVPLIRTEELQMTLS